MALKSEREREEQLQDVEDQLDQLDRLIDRCKVMYEQYFMGIQKMPPAQIHRDTERRIRELTQQRLRNTGLRFRLTTLTQKFGSYNTYWRRTMRQIETGRYVRDVNRAVRRANRTGREVPEEILAALPKLHRERIRRERAKAAERADREAAARPPAAHDELSLDDVDSDPELVWPGETQAAKAPPVVREQRKYNHAIDDSLLGDFDMDSMFASITAEAEAALDKHGSATPPQPKPPRPPAAKPPAATRAKPPTPPPRKPAPPTARGTGSVPSRPPPTPRPRVRPATRAAAPAPPPGMTENQTRDLYERYKQARELVGESTTGLTYDKLVSTLNKQAPRIMKQHDAKGVSFSVVLKGDRAILKARPKKK